MTPGPTQKGAQKVLSIATSWFLPVVPCRVLPVAPRGLPTATYCCLRSDPISVRAHRMPLAALPDLLTYYRSALCGRARRVDGIGTIDSLTLYFKERLQMGGLRHG